MDSDPSVKNEGMQPSVCTLVTKYPDSPNKVQRMVIPLVFYLLIEIIEKNEDKLINCGLVSNKEFKRKNKLSGNAVHPLM